MTEVSSGNRRTSSCTQCHSPTPEKFPLTPVVPQSSFEKLLPNQTVFRPTNKKVDESLRPLSEKVEPMPQGPVANPEIDLKWQGALASFKTSVESKSSGAEKAFADLLEIAIARYGLEGALEDLRRSENLKKEMELTLKQATQTDHVLHSTIACHGQYSELLSTNIPSKARYLVWDASQNDPIGKQGLVVVAKTKLRERNLAALENDLLNAIDFADSQPGDASTPRELTLAPIASSILADTFLSLGDQEKAKKYYYLTSANPMQTATGSVWFQLSAISTDIQSGNAEKTQEAITQLEDVRKDLPRLLQLTREYKALQTANGPKLDGIPTGFTHLDMGSPEEVHEISARSWGLLVDAYKQVGNEDGIEKLEKERRVLVKERTGHATKYEAALHLQNFERISELVTRRHGKIETLQRSGDKDLAKATHDELLEDFASLVKLSEPLAEAKKNDPLMERLGALSFSVYFKSYLSRDLPLTAIQALKNLESSSYAVTEALSVEMVGLKRKVPHIFHENGTVNVGVDMWETEKGKAAADHLMTAYWDSGSITREAVLPGAASIACFAVGAALSETFVAPALAALVCGSGTTFGNREVNKALASEERIQARMSGISLVTEREAALNQRLWYFSNGAASLSNAVFIGPVASIWGRVGVSSARAGLLRAGTWIAAESGGRAMLESLSASAHFAGKVLTQVGKGAAVSGNWFWKLPVGTKLRLSGFGVSGVDYALVDKNGRLSVGDGSLDNWWGYAGYAAGMSEVGYRFFRSTWSEPFTEAVNASVIRRSSAHLATDLISTDYYLVSPSKIGFPYKLVDFSASKETNFEKYKYEKQFQIDTVLGAGGLLLASGDWTQNELRIMKNADRFYLAAGTAAMGLDLANGSLDNWYGGVGGAVAVSVLGNRFFNVSAAGSMAFIPFKLTYEWGIQAMQDVPLTAPDPRRMISSTAESIFMMAVVKGTYQGGHYWNTFPIGKRMNEFASNTPLLKDLNSVENLGKFSFFGDEAPSLTNFQQGKEVAPLYSRGTNGSKVSTYQLRGDKDWNGLANGKHDDITLIVEEGGKKLILNGKVVVEEDLMAHGYVWRDQKLYAFAPMREGSIRISATQMSVADVRGLNDGTSSAVSSQMKDEGWRIVGDRFERWWIERPYHPEILMEKPAGLLSTKDYKIFESFIAKGDLKIPVWLKFSRQTDSRNTLSIGGKKLVTWTGEREKPHFTPWGVAAQLPPIYLEAVQGNKLIFSKTSRGDPEYQPSQRGFNYAITIMGTWPLIQAPLGMDSVAGRVWGGVVGYGPNWVGNWFYPTYRDSAPGQETFYAHLDNGGSSDAGPFNSTDAFNSFGRMITSLSVFPSTQIVGCAYMIEKIAVKNLVDGLECRIDLAKAKSFDSSSNCISLSESTQDQIHKEKNNTNRMMQKRLQSLASQFEKYMHEEMIGDLTARDRRQLLMLGAWIKNIAIKHDKEPDLVKPLTEVMGKHGWFFIKMPKLYTDSAWGDFISQVNQGVAGLSNFYFDDRMQNGQ